MDTQTLRWFQEVADGHTLTEISEIYRISQPAVSRALDRLQHEVGTPLLHKSGRVLRLTAAGATFKRHVDVLIHSLDDGVAAVEELLDPESGTVRLAFPPSLGTWLVPDLVASFIREYPRVQFQLVRSDGTLGSSLITSGQCDLEITASRTKNPGLRAQRLFAEPLALAVPPGHLLRMQPEIWIRDVSAEPFVMLAPERTLRRLTDELCSAAGFEPNTVIVADDLSTVRGFVAAGLGVSVLPAAGTTPGQTASDGVTVVPLADGHAHRDIRILWPHDRRLLPSARAFRDHVIASYAGE